MSASTTPATTRCPPRWPHTRASPRPSASARWRPPKTNSTLQTCRRHPGPRFLRTCPGCAQEQYDTEAANRARAAAAQALVGFTTATARVIDAKFLPGDRLIVATQDPSRAFEYAIDLFRRPTARESDPEYTDCVPATTWLLVEQAGAYDPAEHTAQWAAAVRQHTARTLAA